MKKILIILLALLSIPTLTSAAVATWNSVTFPTKYVQPDKVTGTNPPVKADYFIATSGPSFFEGSLLVNTVATGNESTEIDNNILLGYDTAGNPQWFIVNQDGIASFAGGAATIGATGIITANGSGLTNLDAGSITTGCLAATRGGTNFCSYTTGDLLYASGPTSLTTLAAAASGNALISNGAGAGPSWGKIGLANAVSGTLSLGNGGTGATSYGANRIIFQNSGNTAFTSNSNFVFDGTALAVGAASIPTGRFYVKDNGATGSYTASIHTDDESPWALGVFNDTYSTTNPVLEYFGYNNGRFVQGTRDAKDFGIYTGGLPAPGGERLIINGTTGTTLLTGAAGNLDLQTNYVYFSLNNGNPKMSFNSNGSTYFTNIFQGGNGTTGTLNIGRATSNLPGATSEAIFTVSDNLNVGIGSSTPSHKLSIAGTAAVSSIYVSTTTATAASTTLFMVDKGGWLHFGGGTPVLSGCGTAPALDGNSTDQAGTVTFGATAAGCTITFSTPAPTAPHCTVTPRAISLVNAYTVAPTTASIVITQAASGGTVWDYFCPLGH